jgi:hypothetical protein
MFRSLAASATLVLCACSGGSEPGDPTPVATAIDAAPGIGIALYESLLLGLADCAVTERGDGLIALDTVQANNTALIGRLTAGLAELGARHISDEHPAIRLHAARLLTNAGAAEPRRIGRVVVAIAGETTPLVVAGMLRMVGPSARRSDVRAVLMQHADHDSAAVRVEVVTWLTARTAIGTEDTLERAIDMVGGDPDLDVRVRGCGSLGDRGDERVLPTLVELTSQPDAPPALYEACLAAVIAMWCGPIQPRSPSRAAYDHTLVHLRSTPRTDTRPAWKGLTALEWAADEALDESAPWLDRADLRDALSQIVLDRNADWMARATAVDQVAALFASRDELTRLRTRLRSEATSHPGRLVVERLDKVLAGAR